MFVYSAMLMAAGLVENAKQTLAFFNNCQVVFWTCTCKLLASKQWICPCQLSANKELLSPRAPVGLRL